MSCETQKKFMVSFLARPTISTLPQNILRQDHAASLLRLMTTSLKLFLSLIEMVSFCYSREDFYEILKNSHQKNKILTPEKYF